MDEGRGKRGIMETLKKQSMYKEEIQPETEEKSKYDGNFKAYWHILV